MEIISPAVVLEVAGILSLFMHVLGISYHFLLLLVSLILEDPLLPRLICLQIAWKLDNQIFKMMRK